MEDLVSVVLPAYNHEKFIKECIESVLNQTYKNLEILVEDDCSTDNTKEIIKSIKDPRLKKFYSTTNKGVVDTVNELLKKCTGKYIAFIGSDDMWYPTKIEEQIKVLKENPKLGAVFTAADFIDEDGNKYDDNEPITQVFRLENLSQGERLRKFYDIGNHLCHPSAVLPRKVIEEIGFFNKAFRQLHDYEYWIRLINKYNIYIINKKLMGYRRVKYNNNSISSTTSDIRMFNELFFINAKMIKNIKDKYFLEGFKDLFRNKESKTKLELLCEKYFILLNMSYNCNNNNYAFSFLLDNEKSEELFDLLQKKYDYKLEDYYKDTGEINKMYPERILFDKFAMSMEEKDQIISTLSQEIDSITNSRSWKLTKPIRAIRKLGK